MVGLVKYLRRALDNLLDKAFPDAPAVVIGGTKAVGKIETIRRHVQRVFELDSPHTLSALRTDTDALLGIDEAILIDEWQHYPPVWDRVRRAVDCRHDLAVLLTGSATPRSGTTSHSGTGRIASPVMRPMSLVERGVAPGGIDVAKLLEREATVEGRNPLRLSDYAEEMCASGLPSLRGIRPAALGLQLNSYLARVVDRDLPEEEVPIRRPQALMTRLTAYTAATPAPTSYTAVLRAATAGETDRPSRAATQTYRDLFTRIQVFDPVPGQTTSLVPLTRLKARPKHRLFDPALAARLLDATLTKLLSGAPSSGKILGQFFEALVTLHVRARATAIGLRISHLRTRNRDYEVNLIVENITSRVVVIEIKLTRNPDGADVRHLHQLDDRIGGRLVDKVIVTTGEYAYRHDNRVAVIPLGLLS